LCQNDGGEHQHTAHDLAEGENIACNQPAAQCRKHALQTHGKGGNRGLGVLLPDDLQGVADSAREDAHIKQLGNGGGNEVPFGGLQKEGEDSRKHGANEKLDGGKQKSVDLARHVIHGENVEGEAESAEQDENIPQIDAVDPIGDAEQIHAHQSQKHGGNDLQAQFFGEEEGEEGNQNHVKGSEEPASCRRGHAVGVEHQTKLLEVDAEGEKHAAKRACQKQLLAGGSILWQNGESAFFALDQQDRQQKQYADEGAEAVEQKGGNNIGNGTLRHKSQSPDQRGQTENGTALDVLVRFHKSRSFFEICYLLFLFYHKSPCLSRNIWGWG